MKSRLSRGQAEIIGGLIVVSTLLLIVIPLVINLMTTSTTITTRGYTIRSQFEISRWSEKLISNNTHIINPSSVDIEIVRIWLKDGTLKEFNPWIRIPITSSIPIEVLGINNISEIDIIVTSRGRVFKIEELLPPIITPPIQYPPLGISPENIIAGSSIIEKNHSIIVSCQYNKTQCSNPIAGYYYNNTWWVNFGTGWIPSNVSIKSGEEQYTNLDGNYANELVILVILRESGDQYIVVYGENLTINIIFKNMTRIPNTTSLVTVHLKVILSSNKDVDINTIARISLINSANASMRFDSYATFSSAKVGGAAGSKIMIYEGYVIFPLKQFGIFSVGQDTIQQCEDYDIDVSLYVESAGEGKREIRVNLEYIAVVTY